MSIKVREPEPICTITLTKDAWLSFLVWLTEYSDQAATEDIDKVVQEFIKSVRGVVLSKTKDSEHSIELDRFKAIDLYIHCKDFKDDIKDGEVMLVLKSITGTLKEFLIGGANE